MVVRPESGRAEALARSVRAAKVCLHSQGHRVSVRHTTASAGGRTANNGLHSLGERSTVSALGLSAVHQGFLKEAKLWSVLLVNTELSEPVLHHLNPACAAPGSEAFRYEHSLAVGGNVIVGIGPGGESGVRK